MNATQTINTNFLTISWAVSRGRNTYGYNICRLDDKTIGKRYKTCGGGYDMLGTVIGDWLENVYQDRLQGIKEKSHSVYTGRSFKDRIGADNYYGMLHNTESDTVTLDGGCGIKSMMHIAEAIGLSLSSVCNKKGHVTGYMVTDYGTADNRKELLGDLA